MVFHVSICCLSFNPEFVISQTKFRKYMKVTSSEELEWSACHAMFVSQFSMMILIKVRRLNPFSAETVVYQVYIFFCGTTCFVFTYYYVRYRSLFRKIVTCIFLYFYNKPFHYYLCQYLRKNKFPSDSKSLKNVKNFHLYSTAKVDRKNIQQTSFIPVLI